MCHIVIDSGTTATGSFSRRTTPSSVLSSVIGFISSMIRPVCQMTCSLVWLYELGESQYASCRRYSCLPHRALSACKLQISRRYIKPSYTRACRGVGGPRASQLAHEARS